MRVLHPTADLRSTNNGEEVGSSMIRTMLAAMAITGCFVVSSCASVPTAPLFLPLPGCYERLPRCGTSGPRVTIRVFQAGTTTLLVHQQGLREWILATRPGDPTAGCLNDSPIGFVNTVEMYQLREGSIWSDSALVLPVNLAKGTTWVVAAGEAGCALSRLVEESSSSEVTVSQFLKCHGKRTLPLLRERWEAGTGLVRLDSTSDDPPMCMQTVRRVECRAP